MAMDFLIWMVVAFPLAILLGVRWLYRDLTAKRRKRPPEEELRERYLLGDLTREEYEQRARELGDR